MKKFLTLFAALLILTQIIPALIRREAGRRSDVTPVRSIQVENPIQSDVFQEMEKDAGDDPCRDLSKCYTPPAPCRGDCYTPTPIPPVQRPTRTPWPYQPPPTLGVTPYP